jgi:hypothetical protein
MVISIDEAKHSFIEEDEDGLLWVVRGEEYEEIYGNRIICEAFFKADSSHEEMLEAGYIHFGRYQGEAVYIQS